MGSESLKSWLPHYSCVPFTKYQLSPQQLAAIKVLALPGLNQKDKVVLEALVESWGQIVTHDHLMEITEYRSRKSLHSSITRLRTGLAGHLRIAVAHEIGYTLVEVPRRHASKRP